MFLDQYLADFSAEEVRQLERVVGRLRGPALFWTMAEIVLLAMLVAILFGLTVGVTYLVVVFGGVVIAADRWIDHIRNGTSC